MSASIVSQSPMASALPSPMLQSPINNDRKARTIVSSQNSPNNSMLDIAEEPPTPYVKTDHRLLEQKLAVNSLRHQFLTQIGLTELPRPSPIELSKFKKLVHYSQDNILLEGTIKKRSYLLLRPKRHLILFTDGSLAYFQMSDNQPPMLKAFLTNDVI